VALTYRLEVAADLEPRHALRLLADGLGLDSEASELYGTGILVGAMTPPAQGQDLTEEEFGFRPSLDVWFRLDPNVPDGAYVEAKRRLIRAAMIVLRHTSGDAVLLFNGEQVLLRRRTGRLLLNATWREWVSHGLLAEVTLPHELRDLSSNASLHAAHEVAAGP
jgi:hypothetical protein